MPKEVRTFLDVCQFQKTENARAENDSSYQKFRSSSPFVLRLDFSKIGGETREELEKSYAKYLTDCWRDSGLPEDLVNEEKDLLRIEPIEVWTSLSRLRSDIHRHFRGNLYIILDSLDNIYNLIANLPTSSSKELYSKFTKGVLKMIDKNDPRIKVFSFGVSPYLITEFQTSMVYSIIDKENVVGEYFSFADISIENVIREWQLDVSIEQIKSVARFQYNQNIFINPYLCVSYLKSLKDKKTFAVNISPRSLWMSCIFKEEDLKVLLGVLSGKLNCKFNMNVTMRSMCTLPESSKTRALYYPLFIFGGFLSCREEENDTFTLSVSNETAKISLNYHLELLFLNKFKLSVSTSLNLIDEFLRGEFTSFCILLSKALLKLSSLMMKHEMKYHLFVAGIFFHLDELGYETDHDKESNKIKPDSVFTEVDRKVYTKDNRVIVNEYKHVKLDEKGPKRARKSNDGPLKSKVVNKSISIVKKTCNEQIPMYAPTMASKFENLSLIHI